MAAPPNRRRSLRLPEYDYTLPGYYFITICTFERRCILSDVKGGELRLSELGQLASDCWRQIPEHFPIFGVDACVIMPNHIHGILAIKSDDVGMPLKAAGGEAGSRGPAKSSIGSVVGSFKSAVSRQFNEARGASKPPIWQSNFYEHVIRNERSLTELRAYIEGNPAAWDRDTENPYRK